MSERAEIIAELKDYCREGKRVWIRTTKTGDRELEGVPRNITDHNGNFFPAPGNEHLWVSGMFEHFIRVEDIVTVRNV